MGIEKIVSVKLQIDPRSVADVEKKLSEIEKRGVSVPAKLKGGGKSSGGEKVVSGSKGGSPDALQEKREKFLREMRNRVDYPDPYERGLVNAYEKKLITKRNMSDLQRRMNTRKNREDTEKQRASDAEDAAAEKEKNKETYFGLIDESTYGMTPFERKLNKLLRGGKITQQQKDRIYSKHLDKQERIDADKRAAKREREGEADGVPTARGFEKWQKMLGKVMSGSPSGIGKGLISLMKSPLGIALGATVGAVYAAKKFIDFVANHTEKANVTDYALGAPRGTTQKISYWGTGDGTNTSPIGAERMSNILSRLQSSRYSGMMEGPNPIYAMLGIDQFAPALQQLSQIQKVVKANKGGTNQEWVTHLLSQIGISPEDTMRISGDSNYAVAFKDAIEKQKEQLADALSGVNTKEVGQFIQQNTKGDTNLHFHGVKDAEESAGMIEETLNRINREQEAQTDYFIHPYQSLMERF